MHRFLPVLFGAFALGIAVRSFYEFGLTFVGLFVLSALSLLFVSRRRLFVVCAIALLFFALGVGRMHVAVPVTITNIEVHTEDIVVFEGVVIKEPDIRDTYTNIVVARTDTKQKVLVRITPFEEVHYKDEVAIRGILEAPENFEGEGGRIFNYRAYLAKDAIYSIAPFPEFEVLTSNSTPTGLLLTLKGAYLASLKSVLPEPSAALAGGITVGERRSLGDELTQDFRDTGLIHIVVLSGYNIAIVVLFIVAMLSFLPPKPRHLVAIGGIFVFTILVGASATVVRAAIMGSIASLGVVAGRTYAALYTLVLAGFAMLLWNPYLLIYDPSFQLSFVATAGLLLGVPILLPYLHFVPENYALKDIFAATIATQIAVLPLLVYMIGDVSLVAVLVNLLVLPTIPLAMLFVFLTGVVGMVYQPFALLFGFIAHAFLSYVILLVEFFADVPFAVVSLPTFSFVFVLAAYGLLTALVWYIQRKNDPA
ncbi:ComEC/Rec2 family competence protein [Candidatus Kaiserbacteria bacterium]|nr:MAG: ComEC/Rec2 family competence protein [Candidatus Kaiserbacteria bacterium]